jgi:excisionase family DNA binding protein
MSQPDPQNSEDQPSWDELISLSEAAELSGFTTRHLRHLAINGEIWAKKLGRNWFTTTQAVQEYLARDRRPGPKSTNSA